MKYKKPDYARYEAEKTAVDGVFHCGRVRTETTGIGPEVWDIRRYT